MHTRSTQRQRRSSGRLESADVAPVLLRLVRDLSVRAGCSRQPARPSLAPSDGCWTRRRWSCKASTHEPNAAPRPCRWSRRQEPAPQQWHLSVGKRRWCPHLPRVVMGSGEGAKAATLACKMGPRITSVFGWAGCGAQSAPEQGDWQSLRERRAGAGV
jgi:hypothetical protein